MNFNALRLKAVRTSAIQLQYNCKARIFSCIAAVLRLCGLLQLYNKIFVLCYCSCIVVVLYLCGPLYRVTIAFRCIDHSNELLRSLPQTVVECYFIPEIKEHLYL